MVPFSDRASDEADRFGIAQPDPDVAPQELRRWELTVLRHWVTDKLLAPGCRVCLGGRLNGFQGEEPGVMQEARLALDRHKPLYLMGGFGGAARAFGSDRDSRARYDDALNGLSDEDKRDLFTTTDIEHGVRLICRGIASYQAAPALVAPVSPSVARRPRRQRGSSGSQAALVRNVAETLLESSPQPMSSIWEAVVARDPEVSKPVVSGALSRSARFVHEGRHWQLAALPAPADTAKATGD